MHGQDIGIGKKLNPCFLDEKDGGSCLTVAAPRAPKQTRARSKWVLVVQIRNALTPAAAVRRCSSGPSLLPLLLLHSSG